MMQTIILRLKGILYPYIYSYRRRRQVNSESGEWVFGRVACMGQDVFKLMGYQIPLYNVQKGRVDYLFNLRNNKKLHARTLKVANFLVRKDIIGLIAQQEIFEWELEVRPKMIFMDSYSELTDQLFISKRKKWCFCANYSDLVHTERFDNYFEVKGLLPNDDIEKEYRNYFYLLREEFPDVPIIFMHFPVKLDNRSKFQIRYDYIKSAIEQIANELPQFYSIIADEEIVDWPEEKLFGLEKFPYHYNKQTYLNIAEKLKATGVFSVLESNKAL